MAEEGPQQGGSPMESFEDSFGSGSGGAFPIITRDAPSERFDDEDDEEDEGGEDDNPVVQPKHEGRKTVNFQAPRGTDPMEGSRSQTPATRRGRSSSLFNVVASDMMNRAAPKRPSRSVSSRTRFFSYAGGADGLDSNSASMRADASTNHERVRANQKRRQTMRQEHFSGLQEKANQRHEVAQHRRQFLESKRDAQAGAMWMTIIFAQVFATRLDVKRARERSIALFSEKLAPITRVKQSRIQRRRAKYEMKRMLLPTPTAEMLLADELLALFGEVHLMSVVSRMQPEYYIEGNTLLYKGEIGNHCFAIVHGEVDVLLNVVDLDGSCHLRSVTALGPGSIIGSLGMLTGERRAATIRVRSRHLCVYVLTRPMLIHTGLEDRVLRKALTIATQRHEGNILRIHHGALGAEGLSRLYTFARFPPELLGRFRDDNLWRPQVFRPGEILVNAGSFSSDLILVLDGTVEFHKEKRCPLTHDPIEVCANMSDITYVKRRNGQDVEPTAFERKEAYLSVAPADSKSHVVAVLKQRAMIGGPSFLLLEAFPLTVVARTPVDAVLLSSRDFVQVCSSNPESLRQGRRNASTLMAPWLKVPPRGALLPTLFPKAAHLAVNPLRAARRHWFDLQPVVFHRGDTLTFDDENRDGLYILSGTVELHESHKAPLLWPSASVLFFANTVTSTRAMSRVEAFRIPRRNFVQTLRGVLDEQQWTKAFVELQRDYEGTVGRTAVFEDLRGLQIVNPTAPTSSPVPSNDGRRLRARAASIARIVTTHGDARRMSASTSDGLALAAGSAATTGGGGGGAHPRPPEQMTSSSPPEKTTASSSGETSIAAQQTQMPRKTSGFFAGSAGRPLQRKASTIQIDERARTLGVSSDDGESSSTTSEKQQEEAVRPSGYTIRSALKGPLNRIPMKQVIADTLARDAGPPRSARRCSPPSRSPSPPAPPELGAAVVRLPLLPIPSPPPPSARHLSRRTPAATTARAAFAVSDPYAQLFGETEVASILRDMETGRAATVRREAREALTHYRRGPPVATARPATHTVPSARVKPRLPAPPPVVADVNVV